MAAWATSRGAANRPGRADHPGQNDRPDPADRPDAGGGLATPARGPVGCRHGHSR